MNLCEKVAEHQSLALSLRWFLFKMTSDVESFFDKIKLKTYDLNKYQSVGDAANKILTVFSIKAYPPGKILQFSSSVIIKTPSLRQRKRKSRNEPPSS
jgi:hypothetical protein